MKTRKLPEAVYVLRVSIQESGAFMRSTEKKGGTYTQLKAAAQQGAYMRRQGHLAELWENRMQGEGWVELDIDKVLESLV